MLSEKILSADRYFDNAAANRTVILKINILFVLCDGDVSVKEASVFLGAEMWFGLEVVIADWNEFFAGDTDIIGGDHIYINAQIGQTSRAVESFRQEAGIGALAVSEIEKLAV